MKTAKKYFYLGREKTIREWEEFLEIPKGKLKSVMSRGYGIIKAVELIKKRPN